VCKCVGQHYFTRLSLPLPFLAKVLIHSRGFLTLGEGWQANSPASTPPNRVEAGRRVIGRSCRWHPARIFHQSFADPLPVPYVYPMVPISMAAAQSPNHPINQSFSPSVHSTSYLTSPRTCTRCPPRAAPPHHAPPTSRPTPWPAPQPPHPASRRYPPAPSGRAIGHQHQNTTRKVVSVAERRDRIRTRKSTIVVIWR
jgi:hypothetical protein